MRVYFDAFTSEKFQNFQRWIVNLLKRMLNFLPFLHFLRLTFFLSFLFERNSCENYYIKYIYILQTTHSQTKCGLTNGQNTLIANNNWLSERRKENINDHLNCRKMYSFNKDKRRQKRNSYACVNKTIEPLLICRSHNQWQSVGGPKHNEIINICM